MDEAGINATMLWACSNGVTTNHRQAGQWSHVLSNQPPSWITLVEFLCGWSQGRSFTDCQNFPGFFWIFLCKWMATQICVYGSPVMLRMFFMFFQNFHDPRKFLHHGKQLRKNHIPRSLWIPVKRELPDHSVPVLCGEDDDVMSR